MLSHSFWLGLHNSEGIHHVLLLYVFVCQLLFSVFFIFYFISFNARFFKNVLEMCQKISQIWSQHFLLLFLCFRDSCLALRPLLLWNWWVGGNTLIATLCRVAEMYLTSTHFYTHAHIFIEILHTGAPTPHNPKCFLLFSAVCLGYLWDLCSNGSCLLDA